MAGSTSVLGERVARSPHLPLPAAPVAIISVLALATAALLVAVSIPDDRPGVATELRNTAEVIEQHALTMDADGQRLADNTRASGGADRALWLAAAEHMRSDGKSLDALAQRLRAAASILGDKPTYRANASVATVEMYAQLLRADAQSAIEHGRAMIDQADYFAALARQPGSGISEGDAALIQGDAARIVDAGVRTMQVASRIETAADQLKRALGR